MSPSIVELPTPVAQDTKERRVNIDIFRLRQSPGVLDSVPRCPTCRRRFHSLGNLANHHQFISSL
ncbi:hypothetical protein K492DRAFT_192094 [Lichtheimia hyalospora FSU 10163]|nr:hypothetical protein K492DRAFT_192094 [Lichtheimia hyalospora FSU 10163]